MKVAAFWWMVVVGNLYFAAESDPRIRNCPKIPLWQKKRKMPCLLQDTQDANTCLKERLCCFDASSAPHCYFNVQGHKYQLSQAQNEIQRRRIVQPRSFEPVKQYAINMDAQMDKHVREEISSRALSFAPQSLVGFVLDFPACPVNVPMCHRTRCADHVPGAETNPLACLSDPRCCFDKDLFIFKYVFGPRFMGGAPVCHHGPTSSRYWHIAKSIKPWNPFFQEAVVKIFQQLFDAAINYQNQIICKLTSLTNLPFFKAKKCGWRDISKLECQLRGCCYDDKINECNYPNTNFLVPGPFPPYELYPELYAETMQETTCQPVNDFTFRPSIYKRLPCRCPKDNTTAASIYLQCPRGDCCPNILAFVPILSDLAIITSAASSGIGSPFNSLRNYPQFPGFGTGIPIFTGLFPASPSSLTQFYCPYNFYHLPGFPNLSHKLTDCCKQHACYHRKLPPPGYVPVPSQQQRPSLQNSGVWSSWDQWSTCSVRCGSGQQTRSRRCKGPGSCAGASQESMPCTSYSCSQWSSYGPWSSCDASCRDFGTQHRTRSCMNSGGPDTSCPGQSTEYQSCQNLQCYSWSAWSGYTPCSVTCGAGSMTKTRICLSDGQQVASNYCPGQDTLNQRCFDRPCTRTSVFGPWTMWTECSASCQPSYASSVPKRYRMRCMDDDFEQCSGPRIEIQSEACSTRLC